MPKYLATLYILFFNSVNDMKPSTEAQMTADEHKMWQQFGIEGLCVGKEGVHSFKF